MTLAKTMNTLGCEVASILVHLVGPVCTYYEISFRKKFSPMPSDIFLLIKTNYDTKKTLYCRVAIPYNVVTRILSP